MKISVSKWQMRQLKKYLGLRKLFSKNIRNEDEKNDFSNNSMNNEQLDSENNLQEKRKQSLVLFYTTIKFCLCRIT